MTVAKANLEEASVNLGYTTIRSPVKGVILDRRVNIGQTVVASLNAPSLFLIAKDLSRMEIWASVNETDVGSIHVGQGVRFTVGAFPHDTFRGKVAQIRLNASMSQSVVTYTVVVEVENRSGKLLPYLTARLQFEVEERHDVLLVPNAALRWQPSARHVIPEARAATRPPAPPAAPPPPTGGRGQAPPGRGRCRSRRARDPLGPEGRVRPPRPRRTRRHRRRPDRDHRRRVRGRDRGRCGAVQAQDGATRDVRLALPAQSQERQGEG